MPSAIVCSSTTIPSSRKAAVKWLWLEKPFGVAELRAVIDRNPEAWKPLDHN